MINRTMELPQKTEKAMNTVTFGEVMLRAKDALEGRAVGIRTLEGSGYSRIVDRR